MSTEQIEHDAEEALEEDHDLDDDAAALEGQNQGSSAAAEAQTNPSTLELVKSQSQMYID